MLLAPTILAELGDARRFANGDAVVRHTGLDVTVHSSDSKRSPGHLSRQGPQVLC
jgi:transposase